MNKIFKVVWSKTKECYVVVSEVAKNNGGKKKVLASILAGLAIMGAGAQMGTPVQAGAANGGSAVNLWGDKKLDGSNNTANTVGANSVAVGNNLVAGSASTTPTGRLGGTAIAIGVDSQAKDDRNIAIGYNNTTEGQDSVAMGSNVIAGTGQSIAIGSTNTDAKTGAQTQTIARGTVTMVNGRPAPAAAIAIGAGAQALDGSGVLAMGQLAYAKGNNDVAIGTQTKVIGNNSTAIGSTAQALGNSSAAYGTQAIANGLGATAVGPGANAGTGDEAAAGATAVGRGAKATKEGASALGWAANASVENAAAIGRDTTANIAGGVALGYQSVTTTAAGVQGYNPADSRTNKYSDQAGAIGTSTLAAVSVGNGLTATRQITGVAAGTADTDAVNVAQLKNVNLKYAGDSGNSDVLLKDGTLKVKGDTKLISTSADATGITVTAKVGDNITTNTDGKAVAPTTNGIATTDNVTQAINNSGWKVTSLNNGGTTNGTTSEKVSPGDTVTFSAGKNIVLDQAGKQFTYSLSSTLKDIESIQNGASKITLNNGGGTTISGGNLSVDGNKITNVAPGTDDTDAVNYKQLKAAKTVVEAGNNVTVAKTTGANGEDVYTVSSTATGGTASTESVVKKAAATGDTNIADVSVAGGKNVNDPGAQYEVSVSKNAVKDAAREAVTVNNGGNTDNPITVTPTKDETSHNTTYAVTFDGDKAAKQIPLTYKANGTGDKTVKLDKGLDFTNGTNTTAEIGNDGVVKFNLNDNVTLTNAGFLTVGDTKVNNDGLTITGGPSVTKTGIDAGNQKITNVAPGTISSTSTDAVNGSQLYDVDQKFNNTVKLTGNTGATDGQALNKTNGLSFGVVGANSGAYIKTSATGSDVTVDLSDDAKTKLNKTYTVSSGSSNVTVTPTTVGDNTDYKISVTGGAAASTWNIASDKVSATEGTVAAGSAAAQNIADTKTVTMQAGKNLTVNQTNDNGNASVAFALDKDLKDLTSVTTDKVTTKEIGLQDAAGNTTTIKKDGDRITYSNDGGNTNKTVATLDDEKHIKPGSYAVQNDGSVTMTYVDGNGNPVAGDEAKITGIAKQDLSNITDAGKNVITGLGTIVKAGDNVTVSEASDATTGQKTYTVNAVTPAVYTKADGTKVVKRPDGTYTTNLDGSTGNDVPASDVIVSFQDAAGNTTGGNSIVNNVGSAIDKTGTSTGDTFLTKLDTAANDTPNAAVNVKDLKNTSDAIIGKGLKFDANSGGEKTNKLGSKVTVKGEGAKADTEYDGTNIKTIIAQTGDDTTIDVKLAKDLTGINSISNTTTGPKMEFGGNSINVTGGNLDLGGNKITNLAPGTDDTDAVNYKQLKAAKTVVEAGSNVTVNKTVGANGEDVYTVNATAGTGGATSTWNLKSGAVSTTEGTHTGDTTQNIADTKSVTMQAGKNLTVKQTNDGNGNTEVAFALDKDLKDLTSVTTDKVTTKEIGLQDAAGNTTTIKKDGDRITYSNDGGNTNKTVATLDDEKHIKPGSYAVQNDGSVTMTYVDGNGNPVAGDEAKITGIAKQDLSNITDAGKNVITGLGTIVKAGDNVTVSEASDATTGQKTYTVNAVTPAVYTKADGTKVVKRPDGTYTTNLDGSTGNDVPASDVIVSFQDAAGNTTGGNSIVNNVGSAIDKTGTSTGDTFLTKLDTAANDTPNAAVNVKDLKNTSDAIIGKGLKFDANSGGEKTNKLGSKVTVKGEGAKADTEYDGTNIKTIIAQTGDDTTIDVKLAKDLTGINSISNTTTGPKMEFGGNSINVTGGNLDLGGNKITNLAPGTDDTDAVNYKQLKAAKTVVEAGSNVTVNKTVGANGEDVYTVNATAGTGGATSTWNLKSGAVSTTEGTHTGDTTQNIADTKSVTMQAGKNLTVKQTNDGNGNTEVAFALDKDLKDLTSVTTDKVTTKEIGLQDAAGNTTTIKKDGDRITYTNDGGTTNKTVATLDDEKHIKPGSYAVQNDGSVTMTYVDGNGNPVANEEAKITGIAKQDLSNITDDGKKVITGLGTIVQAGNNVSVTSSKDNTTGQTTYTVNADISGAVSTEQVVAKTGTDNLATVAPATGSTQGGKNATYEVNVDKTNLENKAEISYKANNGAPQKTTLANGFNFTSDDNSVAITTGANGKVNFTVDTSGIRGKAFNLDVNKEGTGKVENAQTAAATNSVEKGTKFVAGNNLSIRHDGINGDANYDHQVTYALNSDLKGITSITNNGGATMNFGPNEVSITGGNLNMGGNKITNVKNGTDKSDVATVGQLTKVTSNDNSVAITKTTDADGAPVYDLSAQGGGRDPRVDQLGEEIGRVGAQGAALAALKPIQYDPLEPTQIMAGYGNYRGNSAIAMGVAHYKNESTMMHAGLAWAGGSRHMMANAGVTWKVGNRDSEAAVADRYRKGPISSAYAMQQEMASVKAQNAGLKTEVSDLKAENEQMKAQIAAMMAKLGM
ncbi:ESPR-type extended signal peptide-containing protein [Veillonella sp.]